MDVIREAEAITAAAARPMPNQHPNAHKYLPGLREQRIVARGWAKAADAEGDTDLHHELLELMERIDRIEGRLEGRE